MKISFRPIVLGVVATLFSGVLLTRAQAGGRHYYPPVMDSVVRDECGSCHLAYAPSMLPARSWKRLMDGLDRHFGTDAGVAPTVAAHIGRYLEEGAADTGGARYGRKLIRGISPQGAPLRITELPKWTHEHDKLAAADWKSKDVGSKANCAACHVGAERGYYDER